MVFVESHHGPPVIFDPHDIPPPVHDGLALELIEAPLHLCPGLLQLVFSALLPKLLPFLLGVDQPPPPLGAPDKHEPDHQCRQHDIDNDLFGDDHPIPAKVEAIHRVCQIVQEPAIAPQLSLTQRATVLTD